MAATRWTGGPWGCASGFSQTGGLSGFGAGPHGAVMLNVEIHQPCHRGTGAPVPACTRAMVPRSGSNPALPPGWEQKAVVQPKPRSLHYLLLLVECHGKCGGTCSEWDEASPIPASRSVTGGGMGTPGKS